MASVTEISGRSGDNQVKAAEDGPTLVDFLQALSAYFMQEFARGREVDQIFDGLEETYGRLEKAQRKP